MEMKRTLSGLVALLLMTTVAGCGTNAKSAIPRPSVHSSGPASPSPGVEAVSPIAPAYNAFGLELYARLSAAKPKENLFISPASVAIALSMVLNGAQGATREAMAKTLHLDVLDADTWNRSAAELQDRLTHADPKVELSIANSIWAKNEKSLKFQEAFLKTIKDFYKAETASVDFGDPKTVDKINKWVDKQTKGKIDSIVKAPMDPNVIMLLLNAVYFKGSWTTTFSKDATRDAAFTLADGTKKTYPFMQRSGSFEYKKADGYQAVRLPYGDGNLGMLILLPDEGARLETFTERLARAGEWDRTLADWKPQQGEVLLPRFKLESELELNDALKSLGMSIAFDDRQADFSGLLTPPVQAFIGEVKHKTFIQVDEKGTEAAAVTSVGVKTSSAMVPTTPPFRMEMNRPFLIAIQDRSTGAVLFVGSIQDPVQG